jgi:hypothetical protein
MPICTSCTGTLGAWEQFQARAASAGDLDALLSAHEAYLAQLLKQGLLEEEAGQLRETLNSLLANMLRLTPLVGRFNEQVGVGEGAAGKERLAG